MENRLTLLVPSDNPASPVGFRRGVPVTQAMLSAMAGRWKATLKADKRTRLALYVEDTFDFLAILIGGLACGKTFYLPANALPATSRLLEKHVEGFVGQFDATCCPLVEPVGQAEPIALAVDLSQEAVIFTSGSTGEPQAILKRIGQLTSEVAVLEKTFGHRMKDRLLVASVSHNHIYGLLFKAFWPLMSGRPVESQCIYWPEELALHMKHSRIAFISSPAHLKRFAESDLFDAPPDHLPAIFSSGGPLEREAAMKLAGFFGHAPCEVYGSSETGGIAWRQQGASSDASWTPFEGVLWQIDPADGTLMVASPNLYDANWFHVADRARAEENNRFFLMGRVDRIVKIEEKRISLTRIEKALNETGLAAESRVIAVTANRRTRLAAFVVPSEKGKAMLEKSGKLALNRHLKKALSSEIDAVAIPKRWRYLEAFPVNSQGKLTYQDLVALLEAT